MSNILNRPPPTEADRVVGAIESASYQTYSYLLEKQQAGIDLVWHGPELGLHSLTPQQVCDALGTKAAKLFAWHGQLTRFLLTQGAVEGFTPAVKFPVNAFTENPDGTITIDTGSPYVFTP